MTIYKLYNSEKMLHILFTWLNWYITYVLYSILINILNVSSKNLIDVLDCDL